MTHAERQENSSLVFLWDRLVCNGLLAAQHNHLKEGLRAFDHVFVEATRAEIEGVRKPGLSRICEDAGMKPSEKAPQLLQLILHWGARENWMEV